MKKQKKSEKEGRGRKRLKKVVSSKQVGSRVLRHARASVIGDVMVGKLLQNKLETFSTKEIYRNWAERYTIVHIHRLPSTQFVSDIEYRSSSNDHRFPNGY